MGGKAKFLVSKYGMIFGYPFESCAHGLDCKRGRVALGPLFLNFGSHSRPKFERSGIMGGKAKFSISKYRIIFGYPFESCARGHDCEGRRVVLGLFFLNFGSHSRPKFEQSGIMGGKAKFSVSKYGIIFGYLFESSTRGIDCEGRRAVLGPLFLNFGTHSRPKFEQSGIMGRKAKFCASKYVFIFGYPFEGCTHGLDCERRHMVLGTLFPNSGSRSRPTFEQSGIMGGKAKFSASKYGIIFGYPFEGCTRGLDCDRRSVVLGPLFPNSGSCSRPTFEQSGIMGGKAKFLASKYGIIFGYPFVGCTCSLDCERRCVVLGPLFPNSGSHSRPTFERSGIMGGKTKFLVCKYIIIFESCASCLDCERGRVVLGPLFLNFGSYSKPKFERSGIMGGKPKFSVSKYGIIF
jgi:hypothetical protein